MEGAGLDSSVFVASRDDYVADSASCPSDGSVGDCYAWDPSTGQGGKTRDEKDKKQRRNREETEKKQRRKGERWRHIFIPTIVVVCGAH